MPIKEVEIVEQKTGLAKAAYDFDAEVEGDLSFKVGDQIVLTEKIDKDWYRGKIGSREGLVPEALVLVVKDL